MGISKDHARMILERAMEEEVGVAVEVAPGDITVVRNTLHTERKLDPAFHPLSIFLPAPKDGKEEIFVVKKDTELP